MENDPTTAFVLIVALGVPLLLGAIIGIIWFAGRARPEVGLGPSSAGSAGVGGTWNMQILGGGLIGAMGGSLGATHGRVHVADGVMTFTPDDGTPGWQLPCEQVTARSKGLISVARVELISPMEQLRCNVSREHINRVSRNQIKTQRELRYAREFVQVLGMNGAQVA